MRSQYLVFGQPLIEEAEIAEVVASLRSAWLGTGPKVAEFERRVAAYKGVKYAVAVNSCTAGLHLACLACGLQPGDEVIAPAMTFCATINAIIHAGATPVLADVDRDTFNLDPADVRRKITSRTKAIMPVHFAGRACDMEALVALAAEHGLKIIEDCAHAIETEYAGRKAGTFGTCGVLSFYSTKNIVTGEGGMVLTDDPAIAARLKMLALHGMSQDAWKRFSDDGYKHYDVVEIGFKYNMMDLQAAIGLHQIQRVEAYWRRRQEIWDAYNRAFADLPAARPAPLPANSRHALHLYTLLIDEVRAPVTRDQFMTALHRRNIGTGVHYRAIPVLSVYQQRFGWRPDDFPRAHAIGCSTVSLPISAKLADGDVEDVITAVRDVLLHGQ
ncbi:DegT/DnrJ/EryC1/StrS family aminotransferase [Opitutus sp. ER46]|uniref:DegT/DnrJ/EryC1/StrS family aminotransferase n=1 Tax=Opitutus sp. ER46 TaxID=2161864 RepID=UPI000D317021|nr:DegT/DnrJ/EryC1/StrS family aminotransferase [Opitutus sp. ER46]PTX91109.1 UDP-4-amino-4,6-dideoxy-N-acetyl-beta-L-altrosamine transaminase [Opitutus sp. ER46]